MMLLKRFAARVTGSGTDPFRSARLKLTLVYTLILASIVAILSAALYEFHANDIEGLGRRQPRPVTEEGIAPLQTPGERIVGLDDPPSIAEYLERLGRSILLADVLTIVAGGALSAFLAGRTLRPVRQAVEAEKALFANVAHDLRTPLTVMRSEAEVALRAGGPDAAEARQIVESSLEEIGRMSAMVEQLLDLARNGRQRQGSALVPIDLAGIARSAVERMGRRAQEAGVCLTVEDGDGVRVRGDALALDRAVGNLLENSLAYTPRGGSVTVRVRRSGAHIILTVADTGIGISAEDLPHITEPFYRGDRARSARSGGAGLGLTVVKTTMDEHGGTLRASSTPGEGTTITLRLPAA
jgi:signal transduction histidine kinase